MAFPARFRFKCSKCGKQGERGELIAWSRKERGVIYHESCKPVGSNVVVESEIDGQNPHVNIEDVYKANDSTSIQLDPNENVPEFKIGQAVFFKGHESYTAKKHARAYITAITEEHLIVQWDRSNNLAGGQQDGNYSKEHFYLVNHSVVVKEESKVSNDNQALSVFAEALAPLVQSKLKSNLDEIAIKALIGKEIEKQSKPRTIEILNTDTAKITKIENPHNKIPKLLYYVGKRHHVYLHGPAGSGKSTAAQQVAQALDLSFGYLSLNPQTPDSRILGFLDAGGTYRPTPFYNCYKDGGVFCIDEMDNANAALLTTLNSMLENGLGAFPCGLVPRHKDFVLVATGNTNGKGANPMFPERRPFDTAFSERFTFLFWEYDTDLERKVTLSINPNAEAWLDWVWKAREYTTKNYPKVLVSPRAAFKGAEYLKDKTLDLTEITEGLIFKGLDKETINKIVAAVPLKNVKVKA